MKNEKRARENSEEYLNLRAEGESKEKKKRLTSQKKKRQTSQKTRNLRGM